MRQYYKMIWANFCWQLYIMGKIDIMKGVGKFYSSTGNKNLRKRKLENFWIFILVWIKYCILVAILWSDIFIHDLISQIEHFCYWNFSANFVRQYYKMIWANFCWQLYIMGKIDIMKGVGKFYSSTGNKNLRKRKLENFWIFILVWSAAKRASSLGTLKLS